MQSSNPVLSRKDAFAPAGRYATFDQGIPGTPTPGDLSTIYATPARMTLDDVVVKTGIMLGLLVTTGALTWVLGLESLAFPAALVGLGIALFVTFKKSTSPGLILTYAAVEGVFLGGITKFYESQFQGIGLQAVSGTAFCFGATLLAYKSGKLKATPRFTKMIMTAMVGIFAMYMVDILLGVFGNSSVPGLRDSGPIGIGISLVIVAVASLSFVLDFDMIEKAVAAGVPEKESWRAAFGLVVGLVWLYLEMLRLISKLRD